MGQDKALLVLDGRAMIEVVAERLAEVCAEVWIVTDDARRYAHLDVPVVEDRFRGVGVLGGLHAGLTVATHDLALAVACDMPFLNPRLLRAFAHWAVGYDVAILRQGEQVEPLHAAYRRTCSAAIASAILAGRRRVVSFFSQVRVRYVDPREAIPLDPKLASFVNVNTPEEWQAVQAALDRAQAS
jgi:molybdopterin-guanine dinucleotide biosynthesis protein A